MSASFEMESKAPAQPERCLALRASFLVLVCAGSVGIYCAGPSSRGDYAPFAVSIANRFIWCFVWACRARNSLKLRIPATPGPRSRGTASDCF